jgi:multiple sugar transport system substrate-binding protein
MKKILFFLGAIAILLSGCGKQDNSQNKTSEDQTSQKTEKTISVFYGKGTGNDKYFKAMKKKYEAKYPGRKVHLMSIINQNNYDQKVLLSLPNDASIDVVYADTSMFKSMASADIIAPVPELKDWDQWKNYYKAVRENLIYKDKYYGIPLSTDTIILFYNKEAFKKAGISVPWVPKSWKDLLDTAKKIKNTESLKGVIPFWPSMIKGEGTSVTFFLFLWGTEKPNNILFKDNKWIVKSPNILAVFKYIKEIADSKIFPYSLILNPDSENIKRYTYVPQKKVAMFTAGPWYMYKWVGKNDNLFDTYGLTCIPTEFGQQPKFATHSGGMFLGINSKSNNKSAAIDFLKMAGSKESSLTYVIDSGDMSPRIDTGKMKDYPSYLVKPTEFLEYTHFRPTNADYPSVSAALSKTIEDLVAGQIKTPEAAMDKFARDVTSTLGKEKVMKIK